MSFADGSFSTSGGNNGAPSPRGTATGDAHRSENGYPSRETSPLSHRRIMGRESPQKTETCVTIEGEMPREPGESLLAGSSLDIGGSMTQYPLERHKTVIAFLCMSFGMLCTTLSLSIVHDRVPETPPLPDVVFSVVPQWDLGLSISEYLLVASVWMAICLVIFHRHRWIIFRRVFLIIGLLYLGRSITMLVTALPVANTDYYCSPKSNHTSVLVILERIGKLISGLGLSVNGQHVFCGDYIYSGHTCMLVLAAMVIREYGPRKFLPVTILVYLMAAAGIIMVSISRGHYTVDVIVAYYVTTRVFWMYHTITCHAVLKEFGPTNYLSRVWWFRIIRFFEINVTEGKLPKQYTWPLPFPKRWQACRWEYQQ